MAKHTSNKNEDLVVMCATEYKDLIDAGLTYDEIQSILNFRVEKGYGWPQHYFRDTSIFMWIGVSLCSIFLILKLLVEFVSMFV